MTNNASNLSPYAQRLLTVVVDAVPTWVDSVVRAHVQRSLGKVSTDVVESIAIAAKDAQNYVLENLTVLMNTDVDHQQTNPLQVLRDAAKFPTRVLQDAGVSPPARDHFDEQINPHDVYGLGPHTWRDLGEEVHDAGIEWGAWKAATVLARRREEGQIP